MCTTFFLFVSFKLSTHVSAKDLVFEIKECRCVSLETLLQKKNTQMKIILESLQILFLRRCLGEVNQYQNQLNIDMNKMKPVIDMWVWSCILKKYVVLMINYHFSKIVLSHYPMIKNTTWCFIVWMNIFQLLISYSSVPLK